MKPPASAPVAATRSPSPSAHEKWERVAWRGLGGATATLALVIWASGLGASPKMDTRGGASDTAARPRASVRDSPGWYPNVDPESMSVVIGRRTNAPPVGKRFQGGARSLDDLGRMVCRALHHDSADSLL